MVGNYAMMLDAAGVLLVLIWTSMMSALEMQRTWSGKSESTRKSRINVDDSFTVVKLMVWLTCYSERTSKRLFRKAEIQWVTSSGSCS